VVVGDPVLAFMSLARRQFLYQQTIKLRRSLLRSATQEFLASPPGQEIHKNVTAALHVMQGDKDGIGFMHFMNRWVGKRHPFDTLIVNMDHISKKDVQAAIAWFASADPNTHPPPVLRKRSSSTKSPGYKELG